jgi:hypothetical protein
VILQVCYIILHGKIMLLIVCFQEWLTTLCRTARWAVSRCSSSAAGLSASSQSPSARLLVGHSEFYIFTVNELARWVTERKHRNSLAVIYFAFSYWNLLILRHKHRLSALGGSQTENIQILSEDQLSRCITDRKHRNSSCLWFIWFFYLFIKIYWLWAL